MPLVIDRMPMNDRMHHVRAFLSFIASSESADVPPVDTDEVRAMRGLFYVYLYGAFEKSINESVEKYLLAIAGLNILNKDIHHSFLPAGFDPLLSALRDSSKWQKRLELASALGAPDPCQINNTMFSSQLTNVWSQTLSEIADYLGAGTYYIRSRSDELYLDEVVEKRNAVAHGRGTPIVVGGSNRSAELALRFEALNRLLDAFVQLLQDHFNSKTYIVTTERAGYNA